MGCESPAVVLYDKDGNPVGLVLDGTIYRLQTQAAQGPKADGAGAWTTSLYNPSGQDIGSQSSRPLFVTLASPGQREFLAKYAVMIDTPASILCANSEPYNIGGTTFTIDINGTTQYATFDTTSATHGIFYSGQNPVQSTGGVEKLKVSIDGGALTEIKIGKNITTPEAIAAAIQTQVRASVPNGTNAVCDWNPSDYPGRYVLRADSTGSTSTVYCVKGGDDLGLDIKMDTSVGGVQRDGLDANYYYADDAVVEMGGDLTDVLVTQSGSQILIETLAVGTSATLQAAAGGANTAFGFTTSLVTGEAGTLSNNLVVDGGTTSVRFAILPDETYPYMIDRIVFTMKANNAQLKKFGPLTELTNGVEFQVRTAGGYPRDWFTAVTNAELFAKTDEGEIIVDAYNDGDELVVAKIKFNSAITFLPGSTDNLSIIIRDDLISGDFDWFHVRAEGWLLIE